MPNIQTLPTWISQQSRHNVARNSIPSAAPVSALDTLRKIDQAKDARREPYGGDNLRIRAEEEGDQPIQVESGSGALYHPSSVDNQQEVTGHHSYLQLSPALRQEYRLPSPIAQTQAPTELRPRVSLEERDPETSTSKKTKTPHHQDPNLICSIQNLLQAPDAAQQNPKAERIIPPTLIETYVAFPAIEYPSSRSIGSAFHMNNSNKDQRPNKTLMAKKTQESRIDSMAGKPPSSFHNIDSASSSESLRSALSQVQQVHSDIQIGNLKQVQEDEMQRFKGEDRFQVLPSRAFDHAAMVIHNTKRKRDKSQPIFITDGDSERITKQPRKGHWPSQLVPALEVDTENARRVLLPMAEQLLKGVSSMNHVLSKNLCIRNNMHWTTPGTMDQTSNGPRKRPELLPKANAKTRSKSSCHTCRRKKRKCDETKPGCELSSNSPHRFQLIT